MVLPPRRPGFLPTRRARRGGPGPRRRRGAPRPRRRHRAGALAPAHRPAAPLGARRARRAAPRARRRPRCRRRSRQRPAPRLAAGGGDPPSRRRTRGPLRLRRRHGARLRRRSPALVDALARHRPHRGAGPVGRATLVPGGQRLPLRHRPRAGGAALVPEPGGPAFGRPRARALGRGRGHRGGGADRGGGLRPGAVAPAAGLRSRIGRRRAGPPLRRRRRPPPRLRSRAHGGSPRRHRLVGVPLSRPQDRLRLVVVARAGRLAAAVGVRRRLAPRLRRAARRERLRRRRPLPAPGEPRPRRRQPGPAHRGRRRRLSPARESPPRPRLRGLDGARPPRA